MDAVLSWVKEFLIVYLILTILMHLTAADQYKKYLRFLSGIVLLLVLAAPVLRLFGDGDRLASLLETQLAKVGAGSYSGGQPGPAQTTQITQMEVLQNSHYREAYEDAVSKEMMREALSRGLPVKNITAGLTGNYEIGKVTAYLDGAADVGQAKQELLQFFQDVYGLEETKVSISGIGNG